MPTIASVIIATLVAIFCLWNTYGYYKQQNWPFFIAAGLLGLFNVGYAIYKITQL